jgi:single-strand DNA-binding protein
VSWFDPPAEAGFEAGDEVVVVGAVRRRFFRAGGATQSRTEVVASAVLKATQRKAVAKALTDATAAIASG